jgi:hypothetical protein
MDPAPQVTVSEIPAIVPDVLLAQDPAVEVFAEIRERLLAAPDVLAIDDPVAR